MNTLKYTRVGINRPNFDFATSKPISVSSTSKLVIPKPKPIFNWSDNLRISHEQAGIEPRSIEGELQELPKQSVSGVLEQGMLAKIVSIPELKPDGSIVRDSKGNVVYIQRVFKDILYNNTDDLKQYYKYIVAETSTLSDLGKKMLLNEIKNKGEYGDPMSFTTKEEKKYGLKTKDPVVSKTDPETKPDPKPEDPGHPDPETKPEPESEPELTYTEPTTAPIWKFGR